MPTNDERREVAAWLRDRVPVGKCLSAALFIYDCDDFKTCESCNEYHVKLLADLIEPEPERTCRIVQHRCTNCDHEINERAYFEKVALDDGCWTAESRTANFCPNCGAKVVE